MPGWIIQGVRGEGKSLCAVGKIKEYMERGRPVATNLTLFLDEFLTPENSTISYRLPDHPRLEDLQMLPPAYDPKYKGEDMNGLLVLDELGTWLNSRNWNDKKRLEVLNWLFLSRKDHWDLILLAQDHEMIDSQVRTTCCDYLVQATRLDRQKVPYLAPLLGFLGMSQQMPRIHRYHVYYGLSTQEKPQDTWTFSGKDFYSGYDTNQKFTNGNEALVGTLVDMRATYTNLPANYLTGQVHVDKLQKQIDFIKSLKPKNDDEVQPMAAKKNIGGGKTGEYMKIGLLSVALLVFILWRVFSGKGTLPAVTPVSAVPAPVPAAVVPVAAPVSAPAPSATASVPVSASIAAPSFAMESGSFMDFLLQNYRPRLALTAYSPDRGFMGNIDFYQNGELIERYDIEALHSFGVALIHKPYGADLIYKGKTFIVSAWLLPSQPVAGAAVSPAQTSASPVASLESSPGT